MENDNATTDSWQQTHTTSTIKNENNDDEQPPHLPHHQEHQTRTNGGWTPLETGCIG